MLLSVCVCIYMFVYTIYRYFLCLCLCLNHYSFLVFEYEIKIDSCYSFILLYIYVFYSILFLHRIISTMGTKCCNLCASSDTPHHIDIYDKEYYETHKNEYLYANTRIFIPPLENKRVYVCKIYDGDTFTISTKFHWDIKNTYRFAVRVKGIDCPELRTKDENEKRVAIMAREYMKELIDSNDGFVFLQNITYDKYGRLCANVFIEACDTKTTTNNNSSEVKNTDKNTDKEELRQHTRIDLSKKMISKQLAVQYDGGTKKTPSNWYDYYMDV